LKKTETSFPIPMMTLYQYFMQTINLKIPSGRYGNSGKSIFLMRSLETLTATVETGGFIKENNRYSLAPIFDNGSCLYPNMTDENDIQSVLNSEDETKKRIYTFPTSQILLKGKKSSYYEVINSLSYTECNRALNKIYNLFNYDKIVSIINNTIHITPLQKEFYKHMVLQRYKLIIMNSYEKLTTDEKK